MEPSRHTPTLSRVERRVRLARRAAREASDRVVREVVVAQLDLALDEIAALRALLRSPRVVDFALFTGFLLRHRLAECAERARAQLARLVHASAGDGS